MSIYSHQSMTNHHNTGLFGPDRRNLPCLADRVRQRRELAHWSDRDLHDVGLSWSDIVREVEKPFWRA